MDTQTPHTFLQSLQIPEDTQAYAYMGLDDPRSKDLAS